FVECSVSRRLAICGKARSEIVDILNPDLDPFADLSALISNAAQVSGGICEILEPHEWTRRRIRRLLHENAQSERHLLISSMDRDKKIFLFQEPRLSCHCGRHTPVFLSAF